MKLNDSSNDLYYINAWQCSNILKRKFITNSFESFETSILKSIILKIEQEIEVNK